MAIFDAESGQLEGFSLDKPGDSSSQELVNWLKSKSKQQYNCPHS
jgi:hypothetical protein